MHFREDEQPKGQVKLATFKRILPFFAGHSRQVWFSVFTVIAGALITAFLPRVFRILVDSTIPSGSFNAVLGIGFAYLGLLVASGVLGYAQSLLLGYMGIEIVNDIKKKLLKHVLSLSISFFDKQGSGRLISRIESDSQKLFMLFSQIGLQMLAAFLNIVFAFGFMLASNARFTLYVVAIAPFLVGGAWLVFRNMRNMFRKDRELYARITGFLGEHIKAIPLLRNINSMEWSKGKFARINKDKAWWELRITIIQHGVWTLLMLAPQLVIGVILYNGVEQVRSGEVTVGTLWMFIQYIQMAIWPLIMISEQIGEIQRSFGAADRIFETMDTEAEVADATSPQNFTFEHEIAFNNVHFAYDPEKPVLKGVSFTIKKGSTVAIVGPTGSGKTTIISLLARFYDPQQGSITIDGIDLRQLAQTELRAHMSLVLQDIFLFPGNLLDNLRVLRRDISKDEVYKAARNMGLEERIKGFANGYQTELAEDGGNLSFGERQLLSFSRALTFNPQILIMDEATSSVDPYTEAQLQQSLATLLTGRTSIIIAHRLSTIRHADNIMVIKDGLLVEQGDHTQLMEQNGHYAQLYNTQAGEKTHA